MAQPEPDFSRMLHYYVLDDEGNPRREHDVDRWGEWMQAHDMPLAETVVDSGETPALVTTRFMGADQQRASGGAPVLWETMIFGGPHDLYLERYTSQVDALNGHKKAVALAEDGSS